MPSRSRHAASLLVAIAAGCAPGHVEWSAGNDQLRTALFLPEGAGRVEGAAAYRILLSTGQFGCELPDFASGVDPWEEIARTQAAGCREDSRHLLFTALYDDTKSPAGEFHGIPTMNVESASDVADLQELLAEEPRLAWAAYTGVEEVAVDLDEGLVPVFEISRLTFEDSAAPGGALTLRSVGRDVIVGTFDLPEHHVSGRFRAIRCDGDTGLFDLARSQFFPPIDAVCQPERP